MARAKYKKKPKLDFLKGKKKVVSHQEKVVEDLFNTVPDADTREVLEAVAQDDPYVWTMLARRLRGYPLTYDAMNELGPMEARFAQQNWQLSESDKKEHRAHLLRHRPFLIQPLCDQHPHKVYKKSRQVGVSELSITEVLWFLEAHQGTKAVYTFPRDQQLRDFSNTRIKEALNETPKMRRLLEGTDQVGGKTIGKSHLLLRSAWEANLGEGIDADIVTLDEKDRMKPGIDVAFRESLSSSKFGFLREVSTPTLPGAGVDASFIRSDQQHWFVKCMKCGLEQTVEYPDNIVQVRDIPPGTKELEDGTYEYVCKTKKCRGRLDRTRGQWVAKYPNIKAVRGYQIPQTICPWITATTIMQKKLDYKFNQLWENYVLGITSMGESILVSPGDFIAATAEYPAVHGRSRDWTRISVGIDWGNCHDDQTRVLTENGFKFFRDVGRSEKVAQWDPDTRVMTFVRPSSFTAANYDKPLYHFKGKGVDMMMTGNHRMRYGNRWTGEWETLKAEEVAKRKHATFVGSVKFTGREVAGFTLPGLPVSAGYRGCRPHKMKMDTWLEFLGYYLSEGGLCFDGERPSCLKMSQRVSANVAKVRRIRACLKATKFKVSEFPNRKTTDVNWTIYGKQVWSWVLNNVGKTSDTKRIPREFMNLSRRQLLILFEAMMLGDGTYRKTGGVYHSTSRGLCEDFQELCIRLGFRTSIYCYQPAEGNRKARYRTNWSMAGKDRFWDKKQMKENITRVPYSGKVYCCTVPTGFIVTERNGHVAYQGNTSWVVVLGKNQNGRTYVLNAMMIEDDPVNELASVNNLIPALRAYDPDIICADAGYGKDRNMKLARAFEHRFYAQWYNPASKGSRTFVPSWQDAMSKVLVDRTMTLKVMCNAWRERGIGIMPEANLPLVELLKRHILALTPVKVEEDDGEIWEDIRATGDDHLAHACASAFLGMDKVTHGGSFNFDFC